MGFGGGGGSSSIGGGTDAALNNPTNGQVLTYDGTLGKWKNANPVTGFADPTTTKGDIIAHSTSTVRLGVGTDGQVLTASSAAATGLTWSTPSTTDNTKLAISNNLSDLNNVSSARTSLGLGTAATISSTAGGDLSGTLPNPTVAKINGVIVTGAAANGQVLTASSNTAASWTTPTTAPVTSVAGKTGAVTLVESDVTSLTSDLAGKAATAHTHAAADVVSGTVATARLASGTASAATVLLGNQTWGFAPPVTINAQVTSNYTLLLADAGTLITLSNSSPNTLTVPTNASVAFPIGSRVMIAQMGAGQVTVVAAGGVAVYADPGLKIAVQYGAAELIQTAINVWLMVGRLSA